MSWFRIDPAAEAIIMSMEEHSERWFYTIGGLESRGEGLGVHLWMDRKRKLISIQFPSVKLNRCSKRALWLAYLCWEAQRADTAEKRARCELMTALNEAAIRAGRSMVSNRVGCGHERE